MGFAKLIGIIGVPGDRQDSFVKKVGAIAGKIFDRIIIKEDKDLRGRRQGEVARLLWEGVISSGVPKNQIEIIPDENQALKKAMLEAESGDVIVIFYEDFNSVIQTLKETAKLVESKEIRKDNKIDVLMGRSG